jgi:hypothetical protein
MSLGRMIRITLINQDTDSSYRDTGVTLNISLCVFVCLVFQNGNGCENGRIYGSSSIVSSTAW